MMARPFGRADLTMGEHAALCFSVAVSVLIIASVLTWFGRMAWERSADVRAARALRKQSHAHDYDIYELREQ
jgi:hypothetical protein